MNRTGTVATLCLTLIVGACAPLGRSEGAPGPAATSSPADPAEMLVLRDGDGSGPTPYVLVDGGDGRVRSRLPAGVPATDWGVLYATQSAGADTLVRAIDPNGGVLGRISVPDAWRLPTIGLAGLPGGLSGDGGTLVLEASTAAGAGTGAPTRFAIVSTAGKDAARVITLSGRFTFDALSPDGSLLYVIEHLTRSDYLVRQVDVASGQLAPGAVLDKRNVDERMAGYPATQLPGADGWVYTVYRGHEGDFIHALDTVHGGAICIDLPGTEGAGETPAGFWGLALDATGRRLFATNGALGTVTEVTLDGYSIRTSRVSTESRVTLAKIADGQAAAGAQVAASPDGSTLYVVGEQGVISVATSDLAPVGRIGGERTYRGLGRSAGGSLYALTSAGTIVRIDPAKGGVGSALDGGRYSQILAVLPRTLPVR